VNARAKDNLVVEVRNTCQADITLEPPGQAQPRPIVLPAMSTVLLRASLSDAVKPVALKYTATNFVIAPGRSLPVMLKIPEK
jgi:hypothetical protein